MQYALHDALVKPMPGQLMAPSLAESWSASEDGLSYEFVLRPGLKFHNGDPFTAEDVRSVSSAPRGRSCMRRLKEVEVVDPTHVRFVLHAPWPDFMTYYGTLASAAGWITPRTISRRSAPTAFKKYPVGLGRTIRQHEAGPRTGHGGERELLAQDAFVKRLVYQSVPESTTRLAMLNRGEVDVAYLLEGELGKSVQNDPKLRLDFSGGLGTYYLDFFDMWDPKSPWADQRVRKAASLALDRQALSDADTLGASKPNGNVVLKRFEYALPIDPDPYDPAQAKKLLAEAGYPNGFDAGELYPWPPYFATGEAIVGYLRRGRDQDQAAHDGARRVLLGARDEEAQGRLHVHRAGYGNASTRLAEIAPSQRQFRLWRVPRHR